MPGRERVDLVGASAAPRARRPRRRARARRADQRRRPLPSYASSAKPAARPAPRSTATSKPGGDELRDRVGDERHAALAGRRLPRNRDPHRAQLYEPRRSARKGTASRPGTSRSVGSLLASLLGRARGARPLPARPLDPRDGLSPKRSRGGSAGAVRELDAAAARRLAPRRRQDAPSAGACCASPARSTDDELAEIRTHPVAGARLIEGRRALPAGAAVRAPPPRALGRRRAIRTGRAGERASRSRRACSALADAFDAMTSHRAVPPGAARSRRRSAEVERCAGCQFDPALAERSSHGWQRGRRSRPSRRPRLAVATRATTRLRASSACAGSPRR